MTICGIKCATVLGRRLALSTGDVSSAAILYAIWHCTVIHLIVAFGSWLDTEQPERPDLTIIPQFIFLTAQLLVRR